MVVTAEPDPLMSVAAARALAVAERRVARERAEAEARRADVVPRVREAVVEARGAGAITGAAWLIGSFAWGLPTAQSDVDLLVEGCAAPSAAAGWLEDRLGVHVDVITVTSADAALLPHLLREGIPL